MSKLTLSVDTAVVSDAKKWAQRRGTSVSHLVEVYLSSLTSGSAAGTGSTKPEPPVLRSLRGVLKKAGAKPYDELAYKKHLVRKYL